jgi:hypothetical protein
MAAMLWYWCDGLMIGCLICFVTEEVMMMMMVMSASTWMEYLLKEAGIGGRTHHFTRFFSSSEFKFPAGVQQCTTSDKAPRGPSRVSLKPRVTGPGTLERFV